jgi:hypothetical protein
MKQRYVEDNKLFIAGFFLVLGGVPPQVNFKS